MKKIRIYLLFLALMPAFVLAQKLEMSQEYKGLGVTYDFKKQNDDFYVVRTNGKWYYNRIVKVSEYQFLKYNLLSGDLETNKEAVFADIGKKGLRGELYNLFREDASIGLKGENWNKKSEKIEMKFLELPEKNYSLNFKDIVSYDYLLKGGKIDKIYRTFNLSYVNNYYNEDKVWLLELRHISIRKVESVRLILLFFKNGELDKSIEIPNPNNYYSSPIAITKEGRIYFKMIEGAYAEGRLVIANQDIAHLEEGLMTQRIETSKKFKDVILKYANDCIYILNLDQNEKGNVTGVRLNAFSAKNGEQTLNINHIFSQKFINFFEVKIELFDGMVFNLAINRLAFDKDNNPILFFNVTYISSISQGNSYTYRYHNKGIVVLKFNQQGEEEWSYLLPRNTLFLSELYNASYVPFISSNSGNIHLFFNDVEENVMSNKRGLKEVNAKNMSILRHLVIDAENGKMIKDHVAYSYEDGAPVLITNGKYNQTIEKNAALYFSGANVFKFGTMELD